MYIWIPQDGYPFFHHFVYPGKIQETLMFRWFNDLDPLMSLTGGYDRV